MADAVLLHELAIRRALDEYQGGDDDAARQNQKAEQQGDADGAGDGHRTNPGRRARAVFPEPEAVTEYTPSVQMS